MGLCSVALQCVDQELGFEDIDAHRGQGHIGLARHRRRILRLFEEGQDLVRLVDVHHAEAGGFHAWHFEASHRHFGLRVDVLLQHLLVVHLVDVVARQDDHVVRRIGLDDVDVLIHRVSGAEIPHILVDALGGRQHVEALVALRSQEVPAAAEVSDEAMGLVLRRDRDAADARIQRVGKREIDDAGLAAEIDGRFGAPIGEFEEAGPAPSSQHVGHGVTRNRCLA